MAYYNEDQTAQAEAQADPVSQAEFYASERQARNAKKAMDGREPTRIDNPDTTEFLDLARIGVDTATLGVPQMLDAGIRGMYHAATGKSKPFKRGWDEAWSLSRDAQSRVTDDQIIATQLGVGLLGGKKTGAGLMDDLAGFVTQRQLAPTLAQKALVKPGVYASSGAITNTLEGYAAGEVSGEEMLTNGLVGAVITPTMQAVVGDLALPLLRKGVGSLGFRDDFGGAVDLLRDQGLYEEGMTTEQMLKAAEKLKSGQGVLDLDMPSEFMNAGESTRRFYNGVAGLNFGRVDDTKRSMPMYKRQKELYDKTLTRVTDYAEQANTNARDTVTRALGDPQGRKNALIQSNKDLRSANEVISRITDQGEGKLGATPIDARDISLRARDKLANSLTKQSDLRKAPRTAQKMWDEFTNELRNMDIEHVALGVKKTPVDTVKAAQANDPKSLLLSADGLPVRRGADDLPNENAYPEVFSEANLATLYNARKEFANRYFAPNPNIDKSQRKYASEIIKVVDAELERLTLGSAGISRGAFAKSMKAQEAFDMGRNFYVGRVGEFADEHKFAEAYGEQVNDYMARMKDEDPDIHEMFKAGFAQGMSDKVGERGFLTEMNYFVGNYKSNPGEPTFFEQNEGGVKLLNTMLGDDAKVILNVLDEGQDVAKFQSQLAGLLAAKGGTPSGTSDLIGDATEGVLQHRNRYNTGNAAWDSAAPVLDYIFKPGDRQKARAMMRLLAAESQPRSRTFGQWKKGELKNEDVGELLYRGAKELNMLPENVGVRLGLPAATLMEDNTHEDRVKLEQATRDYLKGLEEGAEDEASTN